LKRKETGGERKKGVGGGGWRGRGAVRREGRKEGSKRSGKGGEERKGEVSRGKEWLGAGWKGGEEVVEKRGRVRGGGPGGKEEGRKGIGKNSRYAESFGGE